MSELTNAFDAYLKDYRAAAWPGCLQQGLGEVIAKNGGAEAAKSATLAAIACRACHSQMQLFNGCVVPFDVPCPETLPPAL